MCRATLPDSAEKMYADAMTIYVSIERRARQGDGVTWGSLSRRQQRRMDEVVRLWEGAAEQGFKEAQYNLGVIYDHGQGVDVNYKKAIEWYEKVAEQGYADAQYNLGVMYYHGHGVDVNYKKAIEWYEKAAKQGDADAQNNLGLMYEFGQGVGQSDSMAMRWYAKAAAQNDMNAQARIDGILAKRRASASAPDAVADA